MRTIVVVGVLLTVALASLDTNAATLGGYTTRDQNRQILLATEGTGYSPTATNTVVRVTDGVATVSQVTGAQALEMQLDFLDANGIALANYASQASAAAPAWPLVGTIEMHERGWRTSTAGEAICPGIEPAWPPEVADAVDDVLPGEENKVGLFTTSISEHWRHPTDLSERGMLPSWLKVWAVGETRADPYDPVDYGKAIQEGWTLQAGFDVERVPASTNAFCKVTATQVHLDAIIMPYLDRVDA